jgi:TonB-dependent starch-binding outer membrane protein SusC
MEFKVFYSSVRIIGNLLKTFVPMKTIILLTIFVCFLSATQCYSQTVTLSLKQASLEKTFKEIRKQTGYTFVYTREQINKSNPVSINIKNASINDALDVCFANQPLTFIIEDKHIIVKDKPNKTNLPAADVGLDVKGKVVNEQNEPVVGATVTIESTEMAMATDSKGEFGFTNLKPLSILVVTSIGYQSVKIPIDGRTFVAIRLHTSVAILDETIIKGYYTTSKRLNTGSVSKVTSEEISRQPVSNPLAALEGRVPGLLVTQENGLPGSNFTLRIRGQNSIQNGNSPLYIIDGVPFLNDAERLTQRDGINANSPFNSINPNDIESMEILKDADATAIYGSRGANGVILITTKKGKAGKTSVDVNYYSGWGKVTRTVSYMNTLQYLQMRHEAFINDAVIPDASNAPDLLLWDTTRYTDWKKLLIGGTANSTNLNVRLSGGNTFTKFSLGANYYKETTVFPGDFADNRSDVNLTLSHRSEDNKFNTTISTSYSYDKSNLTRQDFTTFINNPPNMYSPYNSSGKLVWSEGGYAAGNPLSILLQKYTGITDRLTASAVLSYNLFPFVTIKTNLGYNYIDFDETSIFPIKAQDPQYNPHGSASFGNNFSRTWIIEPQLEFNHKIGKKGNFSFLLGTTWQENQGKSNIVDATGYTNDDLLYSISGAANKTSSNSYNQYNYEALFGRINYDWDHKYLVNLTGRRDGSSRFGPDKQFANFGAMGLGWIFSDEKTIQKALPFLSFGKLRGSYGITGNDQIGNYQYLDTWSNTQYPYQGQPGLLPSRLFNPDYSWEENRKLEVATELGFINNRILLTANWFLNKSANQIIRYSLPSQVGGNPAINSTFILRNFPGVVENTGWEMELNTTNIKGKNFSWNTSFNLTIPRNKLLKFPGLSSSSYAYNYIIGKSLNIIYQYHYLGVDPKTGIYKLEDVNHDNQFDENDYVYGGTTDAKFYGGFENSFQYKGWQLDFLFSFIKQKGIDPIFSSYSANGSLINAPTEVLNHWVKPGDVKPYEQYTEDFNNPAYYPATFDLATSDAVLTDASFIRLKNISLSYSLPQATLKKLKIEKCRLYFLGQNLLTFTKYKGGDPESQTPTSLPPLKMLTAGIQITF